MWISYGVAFVVGCLTYLIHRWRNPKCNGLLPPGSMGLPLFGETIQLIIPSHSLDVPNFFKTRIKRYGPIFRSNLLTKPVIVSADPEFNQILYQQEGKLVELYYMDTISKVFGHEDRETSVISGGLIHKYLRSITMNHFGSLNLIKENLLPQIEVAIDKALRLWTPHSSVEVQHFVQMMVYDINAKLMFGEDAKKLPEDLSEILIGLGAAFTSIPLNIPGTAHHKCLQQQKKMVNIIRKIVKERRAVPLKTSGVKDFLDHALSDIEKEKFVSEKFVIQLVFGVLFASGSAAATITLIFKFLNENPSVVDQLIAEHEAIIKKRENPESFLTWTEYKSMTYTLQVINETLRLTNTLPFMLRKAMKDIQVNGYTIPAGWTIMVMNSILHWSNDIYKDPLEFNPSRWKDLDPFDISRSFVPFGAGGRQCSGSEFAKAFMATFLHVLVTKYRWTAIKGGKICRNPILKFVDGVHIKLSEKQN